MPYKSAQGTIYKYSSKETGRMYDVTRYVAPEFEGKHFSIQATADNVFNVSTGNRGKSTYFKITPKGATNDGD
jgi:hypothetical protein